MLLPNTISVVEDEPSVVYHAVNACSKVLAVSVAILLLYLLAVSTYNVLFHPLRDIPGPTICKITRLPYWIYNYNGETVYWIGELHNRYGPVVRYGPNDLSYSTGDAWRDIYGYEKGRKENGKLDSFQLPPANGVKQLALADQQDHARVRRVFSPAFSDRSLKQQEPLFLKYTHLLNQNLEKTAGKQVNLVDLFNFTAFDIMGDLTFGQPLGLLSNNKYTHWVHAVFSSIKVLGIVQFVQYYPVLNALWTYLEPKSITKMKMDHWNHTKDRVDQRLARGSTQPDIWNLCVPDGEKNRGGLNLKEMHSNAEALMLAGTETTASLLSGLFYLLLTHPRVLHNLTTEIRGAFASGSGISLEGLGSLKYLNACIQEAMRVFPPLAVGIPRVAPEGGNVVLGRWVPAGTTLLIHQRALCRSAAAWTDPDSFVPERWLGAARYAGDRRDWHLPFSYGPRNCLGQNLAWHEMRLVAADLLYHFDLELCAAETGDWLDQKAWVVWERKPLICRVAPLVRS